MDRKAFLKKTMQMGMASGSMLLLNADGSFAQQSEQEEKDRVQMFKEDWVTALIENMDTQLDEKTRTDLMLACGRRCARRGAIGLAQRCKGDLKKMVDTLDQYPPVEATFEGDDTIRLEYKQCLCELVDHGPDRLPDTYCICSQGWIHEMFETVLENPVKVDVIQTVKRGAPSCQFVIHV